MKAILATVIAASLAIGCGVIEEEQTTTETEGTTRTGGETSSSSITPEFTELLGDGEGRGVMVDSAGNIYLIGTTHFGLDGNSHTSETCLNLWNPDQDPPPCTEVFVMKFDNNHNKLWTTQFGARKGNSMVWGSSSMAIDSSGNIFVEGQTEGGINDQSHSGSTSNDGPDGLSVPGWDTFLVKLNSLGEIEWTIQKEPEFVGTSSIAADSQGSIYTRWNYEDFDIPTLTKHQDNGTELWNTPMIPSEAIAVDSSDYLYAAGSNLGKYDSEGSTIWSEQLFDTSLCSTPNINLAHLTSAITFDGLGNTYVSGWTNIINGACTNSTNEDAFLVKFNSEGDLQWRREFGEEGQQDWGTASATDVYGNTFMSIGSQNNYGEQTGFSILKYDTNGNLVAEKQLDTTNRRYAGLTTDNRGGVFITGSNQNPLNQIFLMKINF